LAIFVHQSGVRSLVPSLASLALVVPLSSCDVGTVGPKPDAGPRDAAPDAPEEPLPVVAFPGAEGFGRFALGGRGGGVCHVTSLDDTGPGTFRDCVSRSNVTVVFEVGGWITLTNRVVIGGQNVTIAGQTAPGGGIGVRGRQVTITSSNLVVRFVRFRRGVISGTGDEDTLILASTSHDLILDHCSIGFGLDETFSVPGDEPTGPRNLTVQWSIIAYSLQLTNHSAGSLFVGNDTSVHHTLWALNKTRNPRARTAEGGVLDWVNNVTFGWDARHEYGEEQGWTLSHHPFIMANSGTAGSHYANAVGNVFLSLRPAEHAFVGGFDNAEGVPAFNLYFADNLLDGDANGVFEATKTDFDMVALPAARLDERLQAPEVTSHPALEAYDRVLAGAGATLPERDEVDALTVTHARNQTGVLITTEADLALEGVSNDGYGTLAPGEAPTDTDRDGIPDTWETARALDPMNPADGAADSNGDGFTNLEDYLNSLAGAAP
jgi:hypothetical protein